MRIMITGGGTGGHTSPGVAVVEELQKRDPRLALLWVGRKHSVEERVCESLTIPFRSVPAEGWPRRWGPRRAWVAGKLACAVARSYLHIKKFDPQIVFGVGGYVSLPLMWAAQRLGVPTALHEQNRLMGMANRLLAPRAQRVFLSYADTIGDYPRDAAVLVGNPVRAAFRVPPERGAALAALGLEDRPTVLVCGGSQGAHRINEAVADVLGRFEPEEAQFIWMTGRADVAAGREAAHLAPVHAAVFAFIDDMATACAAADVIVSRSGASTSAELAMLGKPSILVPLPHAAENHQEHNARAFEEAGAAVLVRDEDCNGKRLEATLRDLLGDRCRLDSMGAAARALAKPGAAEAIAEDLLGLVFNPSAASPDQGL